MDKNTIIDDLETQNPWWKEEEVPLPDNVTEREIQKEIQLELGKKQITGIIGLRRAGKTTLLRMLIRELLKDKDPRRICYFSFDLAEEIAPRELIKIYSEEVIREPLDSLSSTVYFFFDEIQKVEDWGNQLKSTQDKNLDIKFVISGSSSINITKGAGESLVGRILMHKLYPFTFREFLRYNGKELPDLELDDIDYPMNAAAYRIGFKDYIEKGGFPELYEEFSIEYLKQIIDLIFFRDIIEIFPVKRTDVLKGLFRSISERSGQMINYSNLSNDLDTQYRTVKDYIQYLQDSFLVKKSMQFEKDHIKSLRKNPKMYVCDHAFTSLWHAKEGLVAETIAYNHLDKVGEIYFNKEPEVDIVLPDEKKAFEIKYTSNISKEHAENLLEIPDDYQLFLVTEETYDTWEIDGREIQVVPLWLLCLSL